MIYLLLFLLDFYSNFVNFVSLCSILSVLFYTLALVFVPIHEDFYPVRKRRQDPTFTGDDSFDRTFFILYDAGCKILKHRKKILVLFILAAVLPNVKTVYIATGIASGNYLTSTLQSNPLAQKVYKIAEQKLDSIIVEQLDSKDK